MIMDHSPQKMLSSSLSSSSSSPRSSTSPCSLLSKLMMHSADLEVSIEVHSELEVGEEVREIEDGNRNHEEDKKERQVYEDEDGDGDEVMLESSIFSASYSRPSSISSYGELKKNFLSFCCHCKRPIPQGRDIYMYRGDQAFCSLECRYQRITLDDDDDNDDDRI